MSSKLLKTGDTRWPATGVAPNRKFIHNRLFSWTRFFPDISLSFSDKRSPSFLLHLSKEEPLEISGTGFLQSKCP